jgi:hypothetical protein
VLPADIATITPLEWMLFVMRDENADPELRDRMAVASAPYCHVRSAGHAKPRRSPPRRIILG